MAPTALWFSLSFIAIFPSFVVALPRYPHFSFGKKYHLQQCAATPIGYLHPYPDPEKAVVTITSQGQPVTTYIPTAVICADGACNDEYATASFHWYSTWLPGTQGLQFVQPGETTITIPPAPCSTGGLSRRVASTYCQSNGVHTVGGQIYYVDNAPSLLYYAEVLQRYRVVDVHSYVQWLYHGGDGVSLDVDYISCVDNVCTHEMQVWYTSALVEYEVQWVYAEFTGYCPHAGACGLKAYVPEYGCIEIVVHVSVPGVCTTYTGCECTITTTTMTTSTSTISTITSTITTPLLPPPAVPSTSSFPPITSQSTGPPPSGPSSVPSSSTQTASSVSSSGSMTGSISGSLTVFTISFPTDSVKSSSVQTGSSSSSSGSLTGSISGSLTVFTISFPTDSVTSSSTSAPTTSVSSMSTSSSGTASIYAKVSSVTTSAPSSITSSISSVTTDTSAFSIFGTGSVSSVTTSSLTLATTTSSSSSGSVTYSATDSISSSTSSSSSISSMTTSSIISSSSTATTTCVYDYYGVCQPVTSCVYDYYGACIVPTTSESTATIDCVYDYYGSCVAPTTSDSTATIDCLLDFFGFCQAPTTSETYAPYPTGHPASVYPPDYQPTTYPNGTYYEPPSPDETYPDESYPSEGYSRSGNRISDILEPALEQLENSPLKEILP